MSLKFINPTSLGTPSGFSNGVLTEPRSRILFIAGQIASDEQHKIISTDFVAQFERALANVIAVVSEAGGRPEQIVRLTIYVVDKNEYARRMREVGDRYRALMGKHFPAMALIEVAGLLDDAAKVEIEGVAAL